jgi:hypothetical protein
MNSTSSQKYKPAIPIKENNNQMADRKILLVVTERIAVPSIKAERM